MRAAVLWFGVLAAPLAWAAELVVGYALEEAGCSHGSRRWELPVGSLEAVVFAVTAVVALAGALAAAAAWRDAGRGAGDVRGRVEWLAFSGLLLSLLFAILVVLTGAGIVSRDPCVAG